MRNIDLAQIVVPQTVAQEYVLHPLGDVDEAGGIHEPRDKQVTFRIGDTITIIAEHLGEVLAYRNYPHDPGDPRIYIKDNILNLVIQD